MKIVSPKKHLGQHFLRDENIAIKIVSALSREHSTLIEIGPGTGILTKHLITKKDFIAFDLDSESIDFLKENFSAYKDKFSCKDFLKIDIKRFSAPVSIIGNFPYNISSQLFFQFYDNRDSVNEVVCMIQKEVAERIASKHGNKVYGILSVLMQAYYKVEYLFTVKPGVFNPPPKVNSAVIRLTRNEVSHLDCDENLFKQIVKKGFGKRRKTLRNALKDLNLPLELASRDIFSQRAEQLSVEEFINLTKEISNA